jgi:signal transduction histidine kinase
MNELSKEELKKENEILSKKADELSSKLYRVNNKLKEAETLKGHFISNVSNEIINPFSSILVLAENLQRLQDGQMEKAKSMASMIFDEAFHLDFQLKNIFAAATIEAGTDGMKIAPVNLRHLFQKAVLFFKKASEQKGLVVNLNFENEKEPKDLASFITDEEKLSLIIKNLLDNAIKFSFEKGKVDVNIKLEDEKLVFTVTNDGKGIPEEEKQSVYDRFRQLDERINSINTGHGLGLSIVSSYINFLNGSISIQESANGKTCFQVIVPQLDDQDSWDDLDQFMIDEDEKFIF